MRRSLLAVSLLASLGCGSLGHSGEYSPQVLNGGTGPYRLATHAETGNPSGPLGLVLDVGESVGRTALVDGAIFYDGANFLAAPPPHDPTLPGWEVDWAQYAPRTIFRSTQRVVDSMGVSQHAFVAGQVVLSPTLAWEAAGVYDPALLVLPSGAVRLYYATAQGIGVAEAPTADGTFTRLAQTPILPDVEGRGAAQSPALAVLPNGDTMLYVEAGGFLFMARSTDGIAFSLVDADTSTAAIDPIPLPIPAVAGVDAGPSDAGTVDAGVPVTEVAVRAPSATTARSQTGRFTVRLYFESRRSDQSSVLGVAGSFDGVVFDRSAVVPYAKNNPSHPSILLRPDGISLLVFATTRLGGGNPSYVPLLGVTPAELPLPAP